MPKENREFTSHVMISQNNDQLVMQIFILADADGSNFD